MEELRLADDEWRELDEEPAVLGRSPEVSAAHYQRWFEWAPGGHVITSHDGRIREVNRTAAEWLKVSPRYLAGQSLLSFVEPEDRPSVRSQLAGLAHADRVPEWAVRIRSHGGGCFDALLSASSIRDPAGQPAALYWELRPAAKSGSAAGVQGEAELHSRALADCAPVGIIQMDAERQCVYSNDHWQEICGLSHDECLGYGWSRVLHPDDREGMLKGWSQAAREGREFSCEHRIVTPNGAMRWVQLRSAAVRAPNGAMSAYIAIAHDITARRQEEETLRSSEERFRALTERSWDAISLVAADGTILYDNPAASTRILGFATGELLGHNAFDRLHPDDRPLVSEQFTRLVQQPGASTTAEFRCQHKDGSWRWIECVGTNLLAEPSVRAIVANYRDITERKQAEEGIRRRNRELAALNGITAAVGSSLELSQVLATFRRLVAEELDVPGGLIFFRDTLVDRLVLQESWGMPAALLSELMAVPISGSHWEPLIFEKKALLAPDFREIALFFSLRLDVARPDWQSYLCVPLLAQDEIQGVVSLFSQAPAEFNKEQLAFFEALGQQVGVALQNARLFEQVRAWRERLQLLARHLVQLQESERQHIARELHDEIGQLLTGLRLTLEMSARLPADAATESAAEAVTLVNELIARVRQLSLDLRPAMLDDLGLLPALTWQFERYTAQTSVQVNFEHSGIDRRFPSLVETAAYRIVQEALTNVARHAGVGEVTVRLWANSAMLVVQVQDEGAGFEPATLPGSAGCGLTGMRERATLLGGQLIVESDPGVGTRLIAELPLSLTAGENQEGTSDNRRGG